MTNYIIIINLETDLKEKYSDKTNVGLQVNNLMVFLFNGKIKSLDDFLLEISTVSESGGFIILNFHQNLNEIENYISNALKKDYSDKKRCSIGDGEIVEIIKKINADEFSADLKLNQGDLANVFKYDYGIESNDNFEKTLVEVTQSGKTIINENLVFIESNLERLNNYPSYFYMKYRNNQSKSLVEPLEEKTEAGFADKIRKDADNPLIQLRTESLYDSNLFRTFEQCKLANFAAISRTPVKVWLSCHDKGGCLSFINIDGTKSFLYTKFQKKDDIQFWPAKLGTELLEKTEPHYLEDIKASKEDPDEEDLQILDYLFFLKDGTVQRSSNNKLTFDDKQCLKNFVVDFLDNASWVYEIPFNARMSVNYIIVGFERGSILIKDELKKRNKYKYKLYAFNASYSPRWQSAFEEYIIKKKDL